MSEIGRPPTAPAWGFFALEEEPKKGARCLLCRYFSEASSDGAIATTNLKNHLAGFHKITRSEFFDESEPQRGSRIFVARAAAEAKPGGKRQAVIPSAVGNDRITELLLDVILVGALPFNFVANPALQTLLSALQPSYRVPHRTTFARRADERFKAVLAEEKAKFVVHGASGTSLQVRAF
jgi:hypothetical protein